MSYGAYNRSEYRVSGVRLGGSERERRGEDSRRRRGQIRRRFSGGGRKRQSQRRHMSLQTTSLAPSRVLNSRVKTFFFFFSESFVRESFWSLDFYFLMKKRINRKWFGWWVVQVGTKTTSFITCITHANGIEDVWLNFLWTTLGINPKIILLLIGITRFCID